MTPSDADRIREQVRGRYARRLAESCCAPAAEAGGACCGEAATESNARPDPALMAKSRRVGYSDDELAQVPEGANLGMGCGNPSAFAEMKPGETVLDLGSGAGIDCFLAAAQVGEQGRVIGVDMTPEMLARARENAAKTGARNVEFRLGEIERLPVADGSVDVVISNCVVNLSPDKPSVFRESFRVLRPGGRLAISDVVARAPLPATMRNDPALRCGCVGGAITVAEVESILAEAGFADIRIRAKDESRSFIRDWQPGSKAEDYVVSATIEATRPA
ncbi:MAG: arsenite methyltransferase [Candidatus Lambdaproteobacteria bacterium]|nr:arsenite methyltransferase [Candidatus Lambdaproteobacteria bacterium]